jgi:hypothetical protein
MMNTYRPVMIVSIFDYNIISENEKLEVEHYLN